MTRHGLFRHILGLLMLPNVTAWRYAIPRKSKYPLTPLYWWLMEWRLKVFNEQFNYVHALVMARTTPWPVSNRDFRIPFTTNP